MTKQDRNAGLTQLPLPGVPLPEPAPKAKTQAKTKRPRKAPAFMADLLDGDPVESQSPAYVPPTPPRPPSPCDYRFSIYGYWFASYVAKDPKVGYWCHVYEYAHGEWAYLTRYFGESYGLAGQRAQRECRKLLVEGQRPEATEGNHELAQAVKYWLEYGEHLFRIDQRG